MFIQVNERPLNVYSVLYYYTREIVTDGVTTYGLYYRLTDGRVLEEIFETEEARALQVKELGNATLGGLVQENTFSDFPESGSKAVIYLAKDTGQMWFWDETLEQYEKIGVSRKGGVYQYSKDLPSTIGSVVEVAKEDLEIIIEPSVPFMDGSEITAHNAIRGIITKSTDTHVTIRTIADMVIDSFVQVENEASLPAKGELNVIYYLKDLKMLKTWNGSSYEFINLGMLDGRHIALFNPINNSTSYDENIKYYLEHGLYSDLLIIVPSEDHITGGIFSFDTTMTSGNSTHYYFKELGATLHYRKGTDDKPSYTALQSSSRRLSIIVKTETFKYSSYSLSEHYHRTIASVLETDKDYATPYTPKYAGSPATKKYVDDTKEEIMDLCPVILPFHYSDSYAIENLTSNIPGLYTFIKDTVLPAVELYGENNVYVHLTFSYDNMHGVNDLYRYTKDTFNNRLTQVSAFSKVNDLENSSVGNGSQLVLSKYHIEWDDNKKTAYLRGSTKGQSNGSSFLSTTLDYDHPYEPKYDGSPATKKYVDTLRNEVNNTYAIFKGTEGEYTALTQEQRDNYFLAVVEPFIEEDRIDLNTVEAIIVDEIPTETILDLTYNEAEELVDDIIVGGEE